MSDSTLQWFDLTAQLREIGAELQRAMARVLASGQFVLGTEVSAFEDEFAAYCETAYAVGVGSGTDALELALRAVGVGPADEVITVANTFIATPLAITTVGAVPVFVDVCESDGLMDPAKVKATITSRTRAIVPVHLYGRCADLDPIVRVAAEHGLAVIEDAAQAHGGSSKGRPAGSVGDAGCFSFYPSKNLGALGDGGAVVTNDAEIAARLRLLRNYGETAKYHHLIAGRNSRLDDLQAAILRTKLPYLDSWVRARRHIAERYRQGLVARTVRPLAFDAQADAMHLAVIATAERDALQAHLRCAGIHTQVHYPVPCHLQPVYMGRGRQDTLPVTERLAREVLSLPMYPELRPDQVDRVCSAVNGWVPG